MSIEACEDMLETAEADAAISEAEAELEKNGQLHDASTALASLRRKHFFPEADANPLPGA